MTARPDPRASGLRARSRPHSFYGMLAACLALAVLFIGVMGWQMRETMQRAGVATELVMHTEEVLREVSNLRESFLATTAAQRGWILQGSPALVREREEAIARSDLAVRRLDKLTKDNPAQQERLGEIAHLLDERAAILHGMKRNRAQPWPLDLSRAQLDDLVASRVQVMGLLNQMDAEENHLLVQRRDLETLRHRETWFTLSGAFLAFVGMLALSFSAVYLEARRRERTERQMTEIVEGLPAAVWQMVSLPDGRRRFIYVGNSAERVRGVPARRLLQDSSLALESIDAEDRRRVMEALEHSERSLERLDCSYRVAPDQPGGEPRWVHKHARLRRLADGGVLWTGYWSDITEEKRLEHALRDATEAANEASRAKSTFLATMSHEIRTPMTGIMGLLELLELSQLDGEQRSTLSVIRHSSRQLLQIIDDILDFSKVEEGRLTLAPSPASLRESVRRACDVHSGVASSRGLLLEWSVSPAVGEAHVYDPLRVGQILHNFLSNAVKFTQKGCILVAVDSLERSAEQEKLQISVTDTGVGVPPERIAQLFQPFEQGAPQIASTYGGTGLGLAICRRLAHQMGGTVDMESTPGRGTRMSLVLTLPLADPALVPSSKPEATTRRVQEAMAQHGPAPSADAAERDGTLVLVVDDHPTNRLVISRQLATLGYASLMAEDGVEALALWQSRRFGMVITDSNMPRMNGYELARAIRDIEQAQQRQRMPILACTANAMPDESARCTIAGMDACLVKPVALPLLLRYLREYLPLRANAPAASAPDGAPAQEEAALFDEHIVAAISGGDRGTEALLIEEFVRSNEADVAALRQAVEAGERGKAIDLAHRIKGAAKTLRADALLRACDQIEENARAEEPTRTLLQDVQRVRERATALEAQLRAHLRRQAS